MCQAAELLAHPYLQPYLLKINRKLNSPRQNTFPLKWSDSTFIRKTSFVDPQAVPNFTAREKRQSFNNDRALNPSISGTEQDSPHSSQRDQESPTSFYLNQRFTELSVSGFREEFGNRAAKLSTAANTPRLMPSKFSATPKRQSTPSKISYTTSKRDSVSFRYIMKCFICSSSIYICFVFFQV